MINWPLISHLHIFQLEGYSPRRFIKWWITNPINYRRHTKKELVYTPKAKNLLLLAIISYLLILTLTYSLLATTGTFITAGILFLIPYPLIFLALLLIKPYEIINRRLTITRTRQALLSQKNLTIIGITGSFGKTTTKNFLFAILDRHTYTLKTPASYNTVFGVAKVIQIELTDKVRYFISEYGAYVRGEIEELTYMVPPQYALLTAIGDQHLERFKSLKNTTLAKFELVDAVRPENALLNIDNDRIREHLKQNKRYAKANTYSFKDNKADFYVSSFSLTPKGTTFTIKNTGKSYPFSTPLFGTSNLENLVAAVSMSLLLKIPPKAISAALDGLKPAPNRLELKTINQATIIDNTYSSNTQGFTSIIKDLGKQKGKKALVTPGVVELGDQTIPFHTQLGAFAANIFDTFILVGHSDRTNSLEQGILKKNPKAKIAYIHSHLDYWPTVHQLATTHDWILLENDLTENY